MLDPSREPRPRLLLRFAVGTLLFIAAALVVALIYFRPSVEYAYGNITEVGATPTPHSSPPLLAGLSGWVNPSSSPLPASQFAGLSTSFTLGEVIARLGPAQADIGSGVYVLQWRVTDGRLFRVSTAKLQAQERPLFVGFSQP
jgi:hypothetical protein